MYWIDPIHVFLTIIGPNELDITLYSLISFNIVIIFEKIPIFWPFRASYIGPIGFYSLVDFFHKKSKIFRIRDIDGKWFKMTPIDLL